MTEPRYGGTLVVLGSVEFDHLDPVSGYQTQTWALSRNFARTLFNVRGGTDFAEAGRLRPDAARELPTPGNGGLSPDGLTYTIRLRAGLRWDTSPPRPVTAADFVRGFKRLANPAQPCGALSYYLDTIAGMREFAEGYAGVTPDDPAAMAGYQNSHEISGLRAVDKDTLVITLTRPASDFLRLLSMQFATAAPVEYDRLIPDSADFRQSTVSNGPYRVADYLPGKDLRLTRNPAWDQASDDLRGQYPDEIVVRFGEHSPAGVQAQLEAGTADLSWDQRIPTERIHVLAEGGDPGLLIADELMSSPYLVFNLHSPNNGGALADVRVRRAVAFAIDKVALADIYGGPLVCVPLQQVIPPGGFGHVRHEPFATPGDRGDVGAARRLLAEAGASSLRFRFPYRTSSSYPAVAASIAADLTGCGIGVELIPDPDLEYYGRIMHTPAERARGVWDLAIPAWVPDWYGNNGRASMVPLFDGRADGPNSPNFGGYQSDRVGGLVDRALQATSEQEAACAWAAVDREVTSDVAIVPLLNQKYPLYHSPRLHGAHYLPVIQTFEYSRIWLDGPPSAAPVEE